MSFSKKNLSERDFLVAQHEFAPTSALSNLDFAIDGLEFAAGVVDLHLPIDPSLGVVDVG
jgi:hypothetical protein